MRSERNDYIKKLLQTAESQGCSIEHTAKGHIKVVLPDGKQIITSGSPGDWRSAKNFKSELVRNGIVFLVTSIKPTVSPEYNKELLDLYERENLDQQKRMRELIEERDRLASLLDTVITQVSVLRKLFDAGDKEIDAVFAVVKEVEVARVVVPIQEQNRERSEYQRHRIT